MQTQCNRLVENGNGDGHSNGAANGNSHAHVFELLAEAIEQHIKLQQSLDAEAVRAMVQSLVDERLARLSLPRPVEVKLPDGSAHKLDGLVHCQFDQVIGLVNEGHRNVLLSGPAGSGKTALAYNLSQALKLDFGFLSLSAGVTETHLFGRVLPQADGSWQYQPSRFVEIYENGGVFLLDEIDAADANVMVAISDYLTQQGLSVQIVGFISIIKPTRSVGRYAFKLLVKDSLMPMSIGDLAFSLCEIGFFRHVILCAGSRRVPGALRKGWGFCSSLLPQDREGIDFLIGQYVTTREAAAQWLRAQIQTKEVSHV